MNVNTSSVQELVRGGSKHDIYYYNSASLFIQERPSLCNTKFLQALVSPNSGSSQLIFSPDQGLSDVFLMIKLKAQSPSTDYSNFALSRGWGYAMLDTVNVRYGGSSTYYWTGSQMLMQNVVDMQDAVSRDTLFELGGQACLGNNPVTESNDFLVPQYAYCYINLPHNTPNGDGLKMNPLPSELLRQPVLVTVNMKNTASVFSCVNSASTGGLLPFAPVDEAFFQVRQTRMINSSDLLTATKDPMSLTYTYPLKYFAQQEAIIQLNSVDTLAQVVNVNLTGFRNGQIRSILLWLENSSDIPSGVDASGNKVYNPNSWYAPQEVELTINGEIFYKSKYGSSLLIDLVNNKQPTRLATAPVELNAGALVPVSGGFTSQYVKVDFSQHNDPITENSMLVAGKTITNSVVNLAFTVPQVGSGWVLHAVYLYNSSLVFANGNAEFTF